MKNKLDNTFALKRQNVNILDKLKSSCEFLKIYTPLIE